MTLKTIPITNIRMGRNPRTTHADPALDALLSTSIDALGLINPITVRPCPPPKSSTNGKDKKYYEIVAGYRRFDAVKTLGSKEIACNVMDHERAHRDPDHANLVATAENIQRAPMHLADEAVAINKMLANGVTLEAVAFNIGMTIRGTNQHAAIGRVPKKHLDAFRTGAIGQDVIFALAQLNKSQLKTYEKAYADKEHWVNTGHQIRNNLIRQHSINPDQALFNVEASGLEITKDLFDDTIPPMFTDSSAFWTLQNKEVERIAQQARDVGYPVIIVTDDRMPNGKRQSSWDLNIIRGDKHGFKFLTPEQQQRNVEITERHEELQSRPDDKIHNDEDELDQLDTELDILYDNAPLRQRSEEELKDKTAIIYIFIDTHYGEVKLVGPARKRTDKTYDHGPMTPTVEPQPTVHFEGFKITKKLAWDLNRAKTVMRAAYLTEYPQTGKRYLLVSLLSGRWFGAVDVSRDAVLNRFENKQRAAEIKEHLDPYTARAKTKGVHTIPLFLEKMKNKSAADRVAFVFRLDITEVEDLTNLIVAGHIPLNSANAEAWPAPPTLEDEFFRGAETEIARYWTPNAEFFDSISKTSILEVLKQMGIKSATIKNQASTTATALRVWAIKQAKDHLDWWPKGFNEKAKK